MPRARPFYSQHARWRRSEVCCWKRWVSLLACSSHVCRNVTLGSLFWSIVVVYLVMFYWLLLTWFFCSRVTKTSRTIQCVAETARAFHCVAEHREHFTRLCCRNSAGLLLCCRTIANIQPWKDRAGSSEAVQAAGVICKLKLYVCMFILCVACCMWCVCILLHSIVHSLAFECIGVALFVESGRFMFWYSVCLSVVAPSWLWGV